MRIRRPLQGTESRKRVPWSPRNTTNAGRPHASRSARLLVELPEGDLAVSVGARALVEPADDLVRVPQPHISPLARQGVLNDPGPAHDLGPLVVDALLRALAGLGGLPGDLPNFLQALQGLAQLLVDDVLGRAGGP